MKFVASVASVGLVLLVAPTIEAQSIPKQGFNFNPPPCPGRSTGATISTNKFSDGTPLPSCGGREQGDFSIKTYQLVWTGHVWAEYTPSVKVTNPPIPPCPGRSNGASTGTNKFADGTPMPSCGGREQSGNVIKTYELVWNGHAWAEYAPSVKTTTVGPPPAPTHGSAPSNTPSLTPSIVATLPTGTMNGTPVYLYQNNWVSLVASGGGNYATNLVASGAGNLVASGGGNLVASGGGNLVGPSGGTYSLQSVSSGGTVRTSAGHNIVLNAANLAKYKQATGVR